MMMAVNDDDHKRPAIFHDRGIYGVMDESRMVVLPRERARSVRLSAV